MDKQASILGSKTGTRLRHILLGAGSFVLLVATPAATSFAQSSAQASRNAPAEAVAWVVSVSKSAEARRGEGISVVLKGQVRDGWHVYGLERQSRGPLPMQVFLAENAAAVSGGEINGSAPTKAFDAAFGFDTQYYSDSFTLTVPVQINAGAAPGPQDIPVNVQYQACDGKVCLLPKTVKLSARVNVR